MGELQPVINWGVEHRVPIKIGRRSECKCHISVTKGSLKMYTVCKCYDAFVGWWHVENHLEGIPLWSIFIVMYRKQMATTSYHPLLWLACCMKWNWSTATHDIWDWKDAHLIAHLPHQKQVKEKNHLPSQRKWNCQKTHGKISILPPPILKFHGSEAWQTRTKEWHQKVGPWPKRSMVSDANEICMCRMSSTMQGLHGVQLFAGWLELRRVALQIQAIQLDPVSIESY